MAPELRALVVGAALFGCDVLFCVASGVTLAILCSGGGSFRLLGRFMSAHSTGTPALIVFLLAVVRLRFRESLPFLGLRALDIRDLDQRIERLVLGAAAFLGAVTSSRARKIVLILCGTSLVLLSASAYVHFGFFSGDDVEIHEMTLGHLFRTGWPVWNLRSPFYPMAFIYPAQALLAGLGIADTSSLVFAGRLVVAVLSTASVLLLYRVARDRYGLGVALLAALLLTVNRLHLAFGSTELPRPVSTLFVVLAYACVLSRRKAAPVLAGVAIAVAGAMRFSEALFLLPALVHLVSEQRWKSAIACAASCAMTLVILQAAVDQWYWGTPFASVRAAVDYTLVHRLSSRGFQPPWFYVAHIPAWSDVVIVGLAVYATWKCDWRAGIWAWLPLVVLSGLPHKEPRYLIPILPFVALLSAMALDHLLRLYAASAPSARRRTMAAVAVLGLGAALVSETDGLHFRRSEAEVELARRIDALGDVSGLAAEQVWRLGGRLYLRSVETVTDIDPSALQRPGELDVIARDSRFNYIAITTERCAAIACDVRLRDFGYADDTRAAAERAAYRLFRKRRS